VLAGGSGGNGGGRRRAAPLTCGPTPPAPPLRPHPRPDANPSPRRAAEGGNRSNFGRAPVVRPAPRPFNASEARAQGLQVLPDRYEAGVVVLNSHR
jgi:hypothetical protein